ncbi:unnamed protein product [Protopolystoma xenopodis]|uniref:Uncharacterized protein n=1 Tax=Protopolystoma xenopodis TaxID=117903 RepID=A0A448X5U7_9PLAT|nr:unnamed protein product [Protopolystoma xenopodis]
MSGYKQGQTAGLDSSQGPYPSAGRFGVEASYLPEDSSCGEVPSYEPRSSSKRVSDWIRQSRDITLGQSNLFAGDQDESNCGPNEATGHVAPLANSQSSSTSQSPLGALNIRQASKLALSSQTVGIAGTVLVGDQERVITERVSTSIGEAWKTANHRLPRLSAGRGKMSLVGQKLDPSELSVFGVGNSRTVGPVSPTHSAFFIQQTKR